MQANTTKQTKTPMHARPHRHAHTRTHAHTNTLQTIDTQAHTKNQNTNNTKPWTHTGGERLPRLALCGNVLVRHKIHPIPNRRHQANVCDVVDREKLVLSEKTRQEEGKQRVKKSVPGSTKHKAEGRGRKARWGTGGGGMRGGDKKKGERL